MSEEASLIVGQKVPDFTVPTYEPTEEDWGTISLDSNMSNGNWTLLFFYPADFTFV